MKLIFSFVLNFFKKLNSIFGTQFFSGICLLVFIGIILIHILLLMIFQWIRFLNLVCILLLIRRKYNNNETSFFSLFFLLFLNTFSPSSTLHFFLFSVELLFLLVQVNLIFVFRYHPKLKWSEWFYSWE